MYRSALFVIVGILVLGPGILAALSKNQRQFVQPLDTGILHEPDSEQKEPSSAPAAVQKSKNSNYRQVRLKSSNGSFEIGSDGEPYIIFFRRDISRIMPGPDTLRLLLQNGDRQILDKLSCTISNRLTAMFVESGTFGIDVPEGSEDDGAQIVIRFIPAKGDTFPGNFGHDIMHGNEMCEFHWESNKPGDSSVEKYDRKGLCRIAVRGGKFRILFPKLMQPHKRHDKYGR